MSKISLRFLEKFITLPKINKNISVNNKNMLRNTYDVHFISNLLSLQGFEVEAIECRGEVFDNVVIGKIITANPHPNALKLQICMVDIGEKTLRQIVCGAHNARDNLYVAVALPGTKLPTKDGKEIEIKISKIRDIDSFGMLCSRAELGFNVIQAIDGDGIWELSVDAQGGKNESILEQNLGYPVFDVLDLFDFVLEINITPNRADARSHYGMARELATAFLYHNIDYEFKEFDFNSDVNVKQLISNVVNHNECNINNCFFHAENEVGISVFFILIQNIQVKPSPAWLRNLLENLGQNSINNIVDVSNYILFAYGQPSHAFDFDKLAYDNTNRKKLVIRMPKNNEKFIGLDLKERELNVNDCVIADAQIPQALLGIIGGNLSKVDDTTKNIVIEIANATPLAVRRSSRFHGRSTESSVFFEKGIDPIARWFVATELVALVQKLSDTNTHVIEALHSKLLPRSPNAKHYLSDEDMAEILGPAHRISHGVDYRIATEVSPISFFDTTEWQNFIKNNIIKHTLIYKHAMQEQILGKTLVDFGTSVKILKSLGFSIEIIAENELKVIVPSWRWSDVAEYPDLVEEIARVAGLDNVPEISLEIKTDLLKDDFNYVIQEKVAERLVALGYHEISDFHFMYGNALQKMNLNSVNALGEPIVLINPIFKDQPFMHTSLIPGLLQKAAYNINHGHKHGQLFHLCRTFLNYDIENNRIFINNGFAQNIDMTTYPIVNKLEDYASSNGYCYTKELNQKGRPAETPRIAGVVFGDKESKLWFNTESRQWNLHYLIAHVLELAKVCGINLTFKHMPMNYPYFASVHPGKSVVFETMIDNKVHIIGWSALLHPQVVRNYELINDVFVFELNLAMLIKAVVQNDVFESKKRVQINKFPVVVRDFAFIMPEQLIASDLIKAVNDSLVDILNSKKIPIILGDINIFDIYRGKNILEHTKSVAFSVKFIPTERTLTDIEIQKLSEQIIIKLPNLIGATLR